MKMTRILAFALVGAFALASLPVEKAQAAPSTWLCAPASPSSAIGPRRVTNPNTNNSYSLNGRGCGLVGQADVGYFVSQGFAQIGEYQAVAYLQATAAQTVSIPAGTFIRDIIVQETSGAAITGGLKIGTTAGGTDVVAAAVCAASCLIHVPEVSMLKRVFSSTTPQTLFFGAVTNFASSPAINLTVVFGYF